MQAFLGGTTDLWGRALKRLQYNLLPQKGRHSAVQHVLVVHLEEHMHKCVQEDLVALAKLASVSNNAPCFESNAHVTHRY